MKLKVTDYPVVLDATCFSIMGRLFLLCCVELPFLHESEDALLML